MNGRVAAGLATGLATAAMWGSWAVFTRFGLVGAVDRWDMMFVRYLPAGLILLPVLLRRGGATREGLAGVKWIAVALLFAGGSLPYTLVVFHALERVPAGDQALFSNAIVLVATLTAGRLWLGERLTRGQLGGVAIMLAGVALTGAQALAVLRLGPGHVALAGAALLWTLYTVAARAWRVPALTATAIVCVGGMLAYVPVYLIVAGPRFLAADPAALVAQGLFQGVLTGIVSLVTYTRTIELLGAGPAALFTALIPPTATLLGWLVLGETPGVPQIAGAALVSVGMAVTVWRGALGPGRAAAAAGQSAGTVPQSKP